MKEETKKLFDELFKRLDRIEEKINETKPVTIPGAPYYPTLPPVQTTHYGCQVCGRNGVDNYVCYNPDCPNRIISFSSTTTGTQ